jgi:molecular chaperone DnaK
MYKTHGIEWFSSKGQKNILVFDFGGGTLDLSLIDVSYKDNEVIPKVLAIGGDPQLGGNIIDFLFTKIVIDRLALEYSNDDFIEKVEFAYTDYYESYMRRDKLRFQEGVSIDIKQFIFRLKRNLEQVKIKLSKQENAIIVLEGKYKEIPITRKEFENFVLMSEEINIKEKIAYSLKEISKARKKVDEVLLIGGSSQIPLIKEIIVEVFYEMGINHDLITACDDFEKAVAKGAAIQSAILNGACIPPFMHNKCDSIVARDIEVLHAGNRELLVPKGTSYPFEQKRNYPIKIGHSLSETVNLRLNEVLFENEGKKEIKEICNFQFFLPIYNTNDKITISLNIDEAGLYQIEAVHEDTGESVEFEPNKLYTLSSNDLKQAIINGKAMRDIS